MEDAVLICTGCGSSKSLKVIRRGNPARIACCPERNMREPSEFFVVPEYEWRHQKLFYRIDAIFAGRTDIVTVQTGIRTLPAAKRARLRWCCR